MMGQSLLTFVVLAGVCFNTATAGAPATTGAPGELRCQEDDGTMTPAATICDDELSTATCTALFGAEVAPGATSRSPNCDNDELQDKAMQCARTCGICCEKPEYDCENSRSKSPSFDSSKRQLPFFSRSHQLHHQSSALYQPQLDRSHDSILPPNLWTL